MRRYARLAIIIFWLDLSIRQTFPRQNFVRVNSPNFTLAKLSRYTVYNYIASYHMHSHFQGS